MTSYDVSILILLKIHIIPLEGKGCRCIHGWRFHAMRMSGRWMGRQVRLKGLTAEEFRGQPLVA